MTGPLLDVRDLCVSFPGASGSARVEVLHSVSLSVARGEAVGLVGGSGAGKSTLARVVAGLVRPDRGQVLFDGHDLLGCPRGDARRRRRAMHLVLQDPYASLPPTLPVEAIVAEPLVIHRLSDRRGRARLVAQIVEQVGLTQRHLRRYPHQLSGGERQRVAFARALVTEPSLVLADEPTQMLDASLRRDLVDLVDGLRARRGMALLHITHDLALARRGCDRLVVLRGGRVVEHGPTEQVLRRPSHPYTAALVAAAAGRRAADAATTR